MLMTVPSLSDSRTEDHSSSNEPKRLLLVFRNLSLFILKQVSTLLTPSQWPVLRFAVSGTQPLERCHRAVCTQRGGAYGKICNNYQLAFVSTQGRKRVLFPYRLPKSGHSFELLSGSRPRPRAAMLPMRSQRGRVRPAFRISSPYVLSRTWPKWSLDIDY